MSGKSFKKKLKALKRANVPVFLVYLSISIFGILFYAGYVANNRIAVDPKAFQPLLELIASAESSDNYNAYFGKPDNMDVVFTEMTIEEVLNWQEEYVRQGSPSSAVGRYQIITPTLRGLVKEMDLDSSVNFDQATQDAMAMTLLERRGAEDFVNDDLSREEFAASLAKEWAALPKVFGDNPTQSYYASDGLNKSLVSIDEILATIDRTKPKQS